jgi:hypothetical protein
VGASFERVLLVSAPRVRSNKYPMKIDRLRRLAGLTESAHEILHPYYPAQLCPIGATIKSETERLMVKSVVQNGNAVEVHLADEAGQETVRSFAFDQCVYIDTHFAIR